MHNAVAMVFILLIVMFVHGSASHETIYKSLRPLIDNNIDYTKNKYVKQTRINGNNSGCQNEKKYVWFFEDRYLID